MNFYCVYYIYHLSGPELRDAGSPDFPGTTSRKTASTIGAVDEELNGTGSEAWNAKLTRISLLDITISFLALVSPLSS